MWTLPGPLGEGQRDCALPSHAEEGYPLGGGFREPSSGFEVKRVQTGILVMKFRAISGLEPPGHHLGTMGRPGAHRPGLLQIRTCNLSFAWCTPHRLRLGVRKQGARVVIRVVLTTQIEARACQAEQVANSSVWCTPRKWLFSRSNQTTRASICAACATHPAQRRTIMCGVSHPMIRSTQLIRSPLCVVCAAHLAHPPPEQLLPGHTSMSGAALPVALSSPPPPHPLLLPGTQQLLLIAAAVSAAPLSASLGPS